MKLLVATDLTAEQVQKFFEYYYELDPSRMSAVIVVPERKKSIELDRGISFCIIVSAVNETIADYLIEHTFSKDGLMAHWGLVDTFKVMEEDEVMWMQFVDTSQVEILHREQAEKPHFGWCGISS